MNILIIGSGGREHALCWKVAQSPLVDHIFVAPGNAGTSQEPKAENVDIAADNVEGLLHFAKQYHIDLAIVGPEAALAAGVVDRFNDAGILCFGPTQKAAQLESSKSFCKRFMEENNIPTAAYATFTDEQAALKYLESQHFPLVIKADGLAQGKGVIIALNQDEAAQAIHAMLAEKQFGAASNEIVIEEFLDGQEMSFIVMVDGDYALPLASSQDHKRRDDGDQGPNTGGMGAYSPSPLLTPDLEKTIMDQVIMPTVKALKESNTPYIGFLYAGLMISPNGEPKVLEFNCRLGDPETQPILMRLRSDLVELCLAGLSGQLDHTNADWDSASALSIVMASGGYPLSYKTGHPISGLDKQNGGKVFHAGTTIKEEAIVTSGGRVLAVTALGDTLQDAHDNAYKMTKDISWPDCFFRNDIGHKALDKN